MTRPEWMTERDYVSLVQRGANKLRSIKFPTTRHPSEITATLIDEIADDFLAMAIRNYVSVAPVVLTDSMTRCDARLYGFQCSLVKGHRSRLHQWREAGEVLMWSDALDRAWTNYVHPMAMTMADPNVELKLPVRVMRAMWVFAKLLAPGEACGVLACYPSDPMAIVQSIAVRNGASMTDEFSFDQSDLRKVLERLAAARMEVGAFWHSHPSGDLVPSQSDIAGHTEDVPMVIVNADPAIARATAWRIVKPSWDSYEGHADKIAIGPAEWVATDHGRQLNDMLQQTMDLVVELHPPCSRSRCDVCDRRERIMRRWELLGRPT